MAICALSSNESGAVPGDRVLNASTCTAQSKASADGDAPYPINPIVPYPIVRITPAEPVKRLGTGWHWWFSETVRVPLGNRVEFRFKGPVHLLAL
jgi:AraC family transcriptional regulator